MEKILIVKYTPRNERSKSKELLDYAISKIKDKYEIEILDLDIEKPQLHDSISIEAYALRNYMNIELNENQKESLKQADKFTNQFLQAKKIIFAFPMWNFGLPASVKAYLDLILQKGQTWDMEKNGYIGLCKEKELIVISSAGGMYSHETGMESMNHSTTLMKTIAGFIGAKYNEAFAQGVNMFPDKIEEFTNKAKKEIDEILK